MICPYCGKDLPDGSKFCTYCGHRQSAGPERREYQSDRNAQNSRNEIISREKNRQKLVVILAVVFAALAAGGFFFWKFASGFFHNNDGKENTAYLADSSSEKEEEVREDPEISEDSEPQPEATDTPTPTPKKTSTPTPVPTYDPEEGGVHRYEFAVDDCTWTEAFQKAKQKGGYLARINSQEEWDYIVSELNRQNLTKIQFRIGGRRDLDSREYYWADEENQLYGEQINTPSYWCSSVWLEGEPSFQDGTVQEEYLDICFISSENRWVLNDVPDDILSSVSYYKGRIGYIIEYED